MLATAKAIRIPSHYIRIFALYVCIPRKDTRYTSTFHIRIIVDVLYLQNQLLPIQPKTGSCGRYPLSKKNHYIIKYIIIISVLSLHYFELINIDISSLLLQGVSFLEHPLPTVIYFTSRKNFRG